MTHPNLDFLDEAAEEARGAREWYAARSAAAARRFDAELERALDEIMDAPDRWPFTMRAFGTVSFDAFLT